MTEARVITCPRCHGTGKVFQHAFYEGVAVVGPPVTCLVCEGRGSVPAEPEGEAA